MADFANAVTAIRECLLGTIGSTRTVTAAALDEGAYPSTTEHEAARAVTGPNFEVSIVSMAPSKESPWENSPTRLLDCDVEVRCEWTTSNELIDSARASVRASALSTLETTRAALMRPGNLTTTAAAGATGIVSGCLHRHAGHRLEREDWRRRRLSYVSRYSTVISISQTAG